MGETRSAWVLDGAGRFRREERPVPEPGDGEVGVETRASLVSAGTEGAMIARRREDPSEDRAEVPLGYQSAGVVTATGAGVERFEPGDRVACMGGAAVHSERVTVPCNLTVELPAGVSFEAGACNHLAATALHGVRRADLAIGEHVAVMGLGMVGNLLTQLAQIAGAHAMGIDPIEPRLTAARAVGIETAVPGSADPIERADAFTRGYGMDAGFICFGGEVTDALDTLIDMAKRAPDGHEMGRVVIVGGAEITKSFPVPLGNLDVRAASRTGPGYKDDAYEHGREYPETLVEWTTRRNLEEVVGLLARDRLDAEALLTDRYAIDAVDDAYGAVLGDPGESIGVVITY